MQRPSSAQQALGRLPRSGAGDGRTQSSPTAGTWPCAHPPLLPLGCRRGLPPAISSRQTCPAHTGSQRASWRNPTSSPSPLRYRLQLRSSAGLNQQKPSGDFRSSTASTKQLPNPPHLVASLFGRHLSPVSLSNATLSLAEAVAAARGCSEPQGQPLQPTAPPRAWQDPLEDTDLGFLNLVS